MRHTHKWTVFGSAESDEIVAAECDCRMRITDGEIERRLNATECLDRTQALLLAGVLKTEFGDRASIFREYLLSYSEALEDKE